MLFCMFNLNSIDAAIYLKHLSPVTLSVYIKRLREKIEDDPQNPTYIKTVRGLGYRMEV